MAAEDPSQVLDLIEAFRRSKTMFTALSIGIFDRLHEGPAPGGELAAALGVQPEPLRRILDGCVSLGLLDCADGRYGNTPAARRYLCRTSPDTLAGYVLYSDQALYPMWAHLDDAVREGSNRWDQTFGARDSIFEHFFRTEEAKRDFLSGMHGLGRLSSPAAVRLFNLGRFRRLVDLGGGTGHLAIAACERYAALHGTVFDLPGVVPFAAEQVARSSAASRIQCVAGDFFAGPLPPADLYALGRVLHDWGEETIAALLAKIHAALAPGGGLLILETLLDDDRSGPVYAAMQSLNMLVCTEGRERTEAEYRELVERAGFSGFEARRTGAPLDAMLAIRKE